VRTDEGGIGYVDKMSPEGTVAGATVLTENGGYHLDGSDLDAVTVHETEQEAEEFPPVLTDAEARWWMRNGQP
jgi:hypothetical protein